MKRIVAALLFAAFAAAPAWAQKEVTIGYQDMVVPYRMAQEAKEIEKATGYKVNWKQFGGGGDLVTYCQQQQEGREKRHQTEITHGSRGSE